MATPMARDNHDLEKHIQKQMGCMAGFLHIFDRHHILAGKRIYSAKTFPPESDTSPEPENNNALSDVESIHAPSTPERATQPPTPEATTPTPVPLPAFEGTRSPWKFSREAPRLSLDSRAVVDAKGALHPRQIPTNSNNNTQQLPVADLEKQRRSTSVIARLMGLDEPSQDSDPEPELRRSASESRLPRDLNLNQFSDPKAFAVRNAKAEPAARANINIRNRGAVQRKSFYDAADIFPDTKQQSASIYAEIDRSLKMRLIHEPSKDLDTLKQILEAVQLKGLLHSRNYDTTINTHRNILFEGDDSPIVLMKPGRPYGRSTLYRTGRFGNDSPPPSSFGYSPRARRNNEVLFSPRRETDNGSVRAVSQARARSLCSPTRSESEMRSPNRMRKVNGGSDAVNRRVAPVRVRSRIVAGEQNATNRSPRMRRGTLQQEEKAAEDAYSTVSESSFSTCSHTDTERLKMEEKREGRSLLERCDKLLNSIAEITGSGQGESEQPSPVSVLDSSFYKEEEESCLPSPVMKRCIDYKEQAGDSEDEMWNAAMWCNHSSDDTDFVYISEILRASNHFPEDSDVFLLLEKQQYLKGNDTSKSSTLRRRLIFDTVREILHRNRRLPPWKEASWADNTPLLHRIWTEFRRIRGREEEEEEVPEELFEVICGVLRKDVAEEGVEEWGERHVEMGDVVLDMERLVFKDLIVETIRELAWFRKPPFNSNRSVSAYRRKLLF
ncbi:hypothetical protein PIB30_007807 [Stylosanthes scabra]|uniref:DUF4378 domain-containing protein n=1 Tax=Stylosanthes scabra TaxID=79078 RepID=A0ABU6Q4N0_9FABA|nr:hypothetical protein [Stylosanthes scabra]